MSVSSPSPSTKSKGHIAFAGPFEFWADADGDVYRAPKDAVIMTDGRRCGRFEAPATARKNFGDMILADMRK